MADTRLNNAAAIQIFGEDQVNLAIDWLADNRGDNEFATSLHKYYVNRDGSMTYKQWDACIKSAQGKRYKIKRRKGKAAEPAKLSVDKPGDARFEPATGIGSVYGKSNDRVSLSPADRAVARKAIASADGWKAYSSQRGINTANLSGDKLYDAADSLGVDVSDAIASAKDAARDLGKAIFDQVAAKDNGSKVGTGRIDWQRIREIAREEIALRLKPVYKDIVVVQNATGDRRKLDAPTHPEFSKLVQSVTCKDFSGNRLNVMLVGPTGTGKSYACRQVAELLELDFYFQSQADESFALVGYERVNGEMKYTPFVSCFRDGGVCLLDELDRYDTKALTALNAALANGAITLDNGEVIKRHEDFICIGAANTFGMGASSDFTAAEKLDLSTISRFSVRLDWYVHAETEDAIAEAKSDTPDIATAWLKEVRAVREAMSRLSLPYLADQRCVESGANLLAAGMGAEQVREITYLASLDDDQRRAVADLTSHAVIK